MFFTMLSGVSLGALGKPYIFAMFLFPLLGIILGFKAKKGLLKWLLIILNIITICIIGYLLLLAYGISES
jgi:CHASE2 domain-containing sensor protein